MATLNAWSPRCLSLASFRPDLLHPLLVYGPITSERALPGWVYYHLTGGLDSSGRKRVCMGFCLSYIVTCFCTFINWLPVNFMGRVFGGISTSILFSCFDSWLVSAAQTAGVSSPDLSAIFGSATMINGLVAAAVGVFSNGLVAKTHTFTSPFAASAVCLGVAWMMIGSMWSENYGSRNESATADLLQVRRLREAWNIVREGESVFKALGLTFDAFP